MQIGACREEGDEWERRRLHMRPMGPLAQFTFQLGLSGLGPLGLTLPKYCLAAGP